MQDLLSEIEKLKKLDLERNKWERELLENSKDQKGLDQESVCFAGFLKKSCQLL